MHFLTILEENMNIDKITTGKSVPDEINVVIEIPMNSGPIKYELDKESGALLVDRIIGTSMQYPCNYGFIPGTLSEDGDPADVLLICDYPLVHGCVIRARPIAVLLMEDESGKDEKILAVPVSKISKNYDKVNSKEDLPESMIDRITHFFETYKALEKGKWVKIEGWESANFAKKLILESVERASK